MRIDYCGFLVEARDGDKVRSGILALYAVAVVREPTDHAGLLQERLWSDPMDDSRNALRIKLFLFLSSSNLWDCASNREDAPATASGCPSTAQPSAAGVQEAFR